MPGTIKFALPPSSSICQTSCCIAVGRLLFRAGLAAHAPIAIAPVRGAFARHPGEHAKSKSLALGPCRCHNAIVINKNITTVSFQCHNVYTREPQFSGIGGSFVLVKSVFRYKETSFVFFFLNIYYAEWVYAYARKFIMYKVVFLISALEHTKPTIFHLENTYFHSNVEIDLITQ